LLQLAESELNANCTGTCWNLKTGSAGKPGRFSGVAPDQNREGLRVSGDRWRRLALQPVNLGVALGAR